MSLAKLIQRFSGTADLPVEIPEIRDAVCSLGFQDDIIFRPEPIDPTQLRGIFYQYTLRDPPPYGDQKLCTLVVYSGLLPVDWQRVVCGKELVHVMDARVAHTKTAEEINNLLIKLLGPFSTEDFGLADFVAAKDKMALYQILPVLFPDAARKAAAAKLVSGEKTMADIAMWACLPLRLTELVMTDEWLAIEKVVCEF
jgi:hypothetical protein